MLYPAYLHQDNKSAYSLIFPDLPGCHAAADERADLTAAAQEAVEAHCYGEPDIPPASEPAAWETHPDYKGGVWVWIDLDLTKVALGTPSLLQNGAV